MNRFLNLKRSPYDKKSQFVELFQLSQLSQLFTKIWKKGFNLLGWLWTLGLAVAGFSLLFESGSSSIWKKFEILSKKSSDNISEKL